MATKDTKIGWNCDSAREKGKYNSKYRQWHDFFLNTASIRETTGFEIQTKVIKGLKKGNP